MTLQSEFLSAIVAAFSDFGKSPQVSLKNRYFSTVGES
ncbi:hypothetical protein FM107_00770 [Sphingobacterium sp. JB170]|nr:hypothetical protein FM107_00770 [Sphingobacterium sp. JB170]